MAIKSPTGNFGLTQVSVFTRVVLAGIVGPLIALMVTWYPPLRVAHNVVTDTVDPALAESLRSQPSDGVLLELETIAVGVPGFKALSPRSVLEAADRALDGRFTRNEYEHELNIPFDPRRHEFGTSSWHLQITSFLVPSLFSRAYEVSGDLKYLRAAFSYVLKWSRFESALLLPSGLVFNDHATSARAIVMTELWRQYRNNDMFRVDEAREFLDYARRTSQLLRDDRLYEYRSNHGIMQNLSLLHLAIAFPLLDDAEKNAEKGTERLLHQLNYFVNGEGVVLEHSPAYHYYGLRMLGAAWRLMGLLGKAVPRELADRYTLALIFSTSLFRPDKTLPPIGDTDDAPYAPFDIARFDEKLRVSMPLQSPVNLESKPRDTTVAPAAGFIIRWDGLQHWPNSAQLSQTVLHWGNFPTGAHKHADELGVSIWAGGIQWVRSIGYWPYDNSRAAAVGWRSSNAPHWIGESADVRRSSRLVGMAVAPDQIFLDIRRINDSDDEIRRQLTKIGDRLWLILDSFDFSTNRVAEVIWRFSPEVKLRQETSDYYSLSVSKKKPKMSIKLLSNAAKEIHPDFGGNALWNSGVISNGDVVHSPAIRFAASDRSPVLVSIFERADNKNADSMPEFAHIDWRSNDSWTVTLYSDMRDDRVIERRGSRIFINGVQSTAVQLKIQKFESESELVYQKKALTALHRATRQYGQPFSAMLERRAKVAVAICITGVAQTMLFAIVCARRRRWWPPLFALSSISWTVMSFSLVFWYLA